MRAHRWLSTSPLMPYDWSQGGGNQTDRYLHAACIVKGRFEHSSLLAIGMVVDGGLGVSMVPHIASHLPSGLTARTHRLVTAVQVCRFDILGCARRPGCASSKGWWTAPPPWCRPPPGEAGCTD